MGDGGPRGERHGAYRTGPSTADAKAEKPEKKAAAKKAAPKKKAAAKAKKKPEPVAGE